MDKQQMKIAIETYKAKIEGLEAEVRRKNKVLDQQRKDLESYSDNLGQHAEDYQDLEARNDAKIEEIQQLNAAIGLNEKVLANVKNDRDGFQEQLNRTVKRGQALLDERNELRTLLDQKQSSIDRVVHEREKLRRQLDTCVTERSSELVAHKTTLKQFELRGRALIDEKNMALETLGTIGEERDLLAQELKLIADSNRIRGAKLAGAKTAGSEMRTKIEAQNAELDVRERKIEELEEMHATCESISKARLAAIQGLEREIEQFEARITLLTKREQYQDLDEMRAKIEARDAELIELRAESRGYELSANRMRYERDKGRRQPDELQSEKIDQLRKRIGELLTERDDFARRSDQRAQRIESLENDNEQLDYRIRELIGEIAAMRDELEGEQERNADLHATLDRRDKKLKLISAERDTIIRASEGFLMKLDRRDETIDELRADVASMRGAFEGATARAEDLRSDLARAERRRKLDPESYYLVDWDEGLVDISRSFAEWHLAVRHIPSGHVLGARYEILSGASVQKMIEPRFKMVDMVDGFKEA